MSWRRARRVVAVLVIVTVAVATASVAAGHAAGLRSSPGAAPSSSTATSAASAASGATTTAGTTTISTAPKTRFSAYRAGQIFTTYPKVAGWLGRYPAAGVTTTATYSDGIWQVSVYYGPAGEIATGKVADSNGQVIEAFTGPQVAWGMAHGGTGFGGKQINSWRVWLFFSIVFLLGLIDWRRPWGIRTFDLLALISFLPSLWFFNHGHIFASMSLIYPGFAWLIARCLWIARRNRGSGGSVIWPTWVLLVATILLAGYRIEINVEHSDTIDVGLSGVIGADRIAHFQSPYGHFPVEDGRPPCGPADSSGNVRDHIQTNGKCEAADSLGDTYGPVAYEGYLPAYLIFGWSGKWDTLPTAHATSILWDILAMIGLLLVGLRFGGPRLGATLAFAWAAWPLSAYAMNNNTNDLIEPALLIWGFYFVTAPFKRGLFSALSGWTKFASLVVAPLWSGYPDAKLVRPRLRYLAGFAAGTALAFSVVLFERSPTHNLVVFFHHTLGFQSGRSAPFSLWDWRQYHARGLPDLGWVQRVLQVALIVGALVLARWPRHRTALRLAAYTGALLVGFEAILTYWSFSYLIWFFPFVVYAVVAPRRQVAALAAPDGDGREVVEAVDDEQWSSAVEHARARWTPRQLYVRGAILAAIVFIGSWALLTHGPYANPRIIDTPLYQQYGDAIRSGEIPYRDFALEYPPGALVPFVAATFGSDYRSTFGWIMAGCGLLCLLFVALARPPGRAWVFLAVAPLLLGSIALTRFDFWPAALAVGALAAFLRDKHKLGWAALAAAFAAKLFPAVLVPLAILWTLRRRGRRELGLGLAVFAGVVLTFFVPFFVIAPRGMWDSLSGELSRPLQIETLPAVVIRTFGHPTIVGTHGSLNLSGYPGLGIAVTLALVAALAGLWIAFARGPMEDERLIRYSAACVCAFIVFGKVLSPQFLIWLVPFVPLVRGRRGLAATLLLAVALLDTVFWFPQRYYQFVFQGHLAWLVLTRDLVLVALFAVLAIPASAVRRASLTTERRLPSPPDYLAQDG